MSLRKLSVLFIVAILSIFPVAAQDDAMTIDFWHGLTGPDGAFLEGMVNTFNETNEDGIFVQLNVFHWDVFYDRWVASVAAGDPPDVVIYHINEMPQYADRGVAAPIDTLVEEVGVDMSGFSDVIVDMSMRDGDLYGFQSTFTRSACITMSMLLKPPGLTRTAHPPTPKSCWHGQPRSPLTTMAMARSTNTAYPRRRLTS